MRRYSKEVYKMAGVVGGLPFDDDTVIETWREGNHSSVYIDGFPFCDTDAPAAAHLVKEELKRREDVAKNYGCTFAKVN